MAGTLPRYLHRICLSSLQSHVKNLQLLELAPKKLKGWPLAESHLWHLVEEEHLFTANNHLYKRKDYWNDDDYEQVTHLLLSPAQRRCQMEGPQAVPGSEILCHTKWTPQASNLCKPWQSRALGKGRPREGNAAQGKGMWGSTTQLPGGDFAHPRTGLWEKALHLWRTLFNTKWAQNVVQRVLVKWDDLVSLIKINTAIWKSLDKWATWDDLFAVMLLGDITAVNHKTINCCYSGILLINTSILKSNSVKLKLLMGSCQFWQKQATKLTLVKISQVPDDICDP